MKKRKSKKESVEAPVATPEAYSVNPDDIEIGDEIITVREAKKQRKLKQDEDH